MKRAGEWNDIFLKMDWGEVQGTVQLTVTDVDRKRFKIGFFFSRENGIKRDNTLEFEVVMLVLRI